MSIPGTFSAYPLLALAHRRLSALELTTLMATVGLAGLLAYVLATSVQAPGVALAAGLIGLAIAGLIMTGRRWTATLGSLFAFVVGALVLAPAPDDVARALTQPADPLYAPLMLLLPLLALCITAGAAATVQNVRHSRPGRRTPLWLAPLAAGLTGAALGGLLLGGVPRPTVTHGISPTLLATLPALRTSGFAFDQQEIHARVGETVALRLDNSDSTTHTFTVDELGVDVPIVPGQSSVALFRPTQPGTFVFYCVPHYDRASGQGMHGTLIVE